MSLHLENWPNFGSHFVQFPICKNVQFLCLNYGKIITILAVTKRNKKSRCLVAMFSWWWTDTGSPRRAACDGRWNSRTRHWYSARGWGYAMLDLGPAQSKLGLLYLYFVTIIPSNITLKINYSTKCNECQY